VFEFDKLPNIRFVTLAAPDTPPGAARVAAVVLSRAVASAAEPAQPADAGPVASADGDADAGVGPAAAGCAGPMLSGTAAADWVGVTVRRVLSSTEDPARDAGLAFRLEQQTHAVGELAGGSFHGDPGCARTVRLRKMISCVQYILNVSRRLAVARGPREYYRPRGPGVGRGGEGKLLGSGAAIGAGG